MIRAVRNFIRTAGAASFFSAMAVAMMPIAYADNPISSQSPVPDVTSIAEFNQKILCPIVGWFFVIVMIISVIMILSGAFMYASAGGEPEKITKANKTIIYAAVGIAVALLTRAVPIVVASLLGVTAPSVC